MLPLMIDRKAVLFHLYPTPEQAAQMAQIAGACRFVYNLALEQRRDWYRPGRRFTFASQCREVTQLRAEVAWLKACPVHTLQQALRDLDRAYQNWWAGRAKAPTPRRKGLNDSFRFPDPISLVVERTGASSGRVKLPKLGWVRLRGWTALPGAIRTITVSHRARHWFAAVQCEREVAEPVPSPLPPVGIDIGVAVFAALSDGTAIAPVNHGKTALKALRKAQRALARKRRGSANRRKAVQRVARLQKRVANARKDFLHKHSTIIAKNHGVVVVEALPVRSMSASAKGTVAEPGRRVRQKAGLNRAILDQGSGSVPYHAGLQVGGSWRKAGGGARRPHQPDLRLLRPCRCRQPAEPSRLCVRALWPQRQRRYQRGDQYSPARGRRVEACGGAPHQAAR